MSSYRPTLPDGWRWRDEFGRGHAESDAAWCRVVERAKQPCVCLDGYVPDDVVEACIEDFYEPSTCCRGDDWIRIGAWDGARSRSIWVRLTFDEGTCVSIELCAGREGSDDYVKILPTDVSPAWSPGNPPIYSLLVELLKSQLWALGAG